ncbi:NHS-like protein 2 [Antennarius striatus]|uniref:NHS-like protein 2 n=1 Tax=Antennarius striatus TaxID=241820 RepID=UPI0035B09B27
MRNTGCPRTEGLLRVDCRNTVFKQQHPKRREQMIKCLTARRTQSTGGHAKAKAKAKGDQMSKKASKSNQVNLREQKMVSKESPEHDQEPRDYPHVAATHCHQRQWSADLCRPGSSHFIIVRKNKKEPRPPQRGVSLRKTSAEPSHPCTGTFGRPCHPHSSSSSPSSSSTSSCSSPPYVQTSVITGHDPPGWRWRTKTDPRGVCDKRLSLQIPLPVISPDPKRSPGDNSCDPDLLHKTRTPLKPIPSHRPHSDSSAFLRSLATPLPVVTADELCAVRLRSFTLSDVSDDVFGRGDEEEVRLPPPVPEKTSVAKQTAQLIAHSHQHGKTDEEHTCSSYRICSGNKTFTST